MPQDACILAAYDFRNEHRAKPASEMERSGIELGHCGCDNRNEHRAKPASEMEQSGIELGHCGCDNRSEHRAKARERDGAVLDIRGMSA